MSEREVTDTVHGSEEKVDQIGTGFLDAVRYAATYLVAAVLMTLFAWYEITNNVSPSFVGELVFSFLAVVLFIAAAIRLFGRWGAVDFFQL
jgi:hypothetical protein